MDHKTVSEEWFQYANSDFEAAKFLQSMRPVPLEIICYHCQQSGEKYLKGFIAYNGGEIHKTHDLITLNKICTLYNQRFAEITDDCINLTDYGVQTRYPFELEINEKDMYMAIQSAANIQKFVMQFIE
jgi:HEPN domain-containing protein